MEFRPAIAARHPILAFAGYIGATQPPAAIVVHSKLARPVGLGAVQETIPPACLTVWGVAVLLVFRGARLPLP